MGAKTMQNRQKSVVPCVLQPISMRLQIGMDPAREAAWFVLII